MKRIKGTRGGIRRRRRRSAHVCVTLILIATDADSAIMGAELNV